MKKILAFLFLLLVLTSVILPLTACGKKEEPLELSVQTSVNLKYNGYDTTLIRGVKALKENGYYGKLTALITAKREDESIIIVYCNNKKIADKVYEELLKMESDDVKVERIGEDGKIVYAGTKKAVRAAEHKLFKSKLYYCFIDEGNYKLFLEGFGNTVKITLGALLIGLVIGVLIAVAKYYSEGNPKLRIINMICDVYTTVIRGIPITVLLLIFFFIILATAKGVTVAIIAFGINSGAYMAELVRSGINAVDKGQMEAARSLGMSKWQAMRKIIFPQAIKNVLPAIGNECIALLKETSVAGYVAVVDLTRGANLIKNNSFDPVTPILFSALIYLVLVVAMTQLLSILERRLKKNERRIAK
jgi:His/Glu/Gln/Arg/opine family amino acid ABC transporter permease subunit